MSYYEETEARRLVIEAGLRLVREGLIARTWGNISARISEDQFVITPSGRAYDDLKPEELVVVNGRDGSYDGPIKPSSEQGIHAAAYRLRPEVTFIIHTHQFFASAIGISGQGFPFAPCAAYGLPGTRELWAAVESTVAAHRKSAAFLMTKHGALCLGTDAANAFAVAEQLEKSAQMIFYKVTGLSQPEEITAAYCRTHHVLLPYVDDFAQIVGCRAPVQDGKLCLPSSDDPEATSMITAKNCAAALYAEQCGGQPLSRWDSFLQRLVYLTKYSKQNTKNKK